MIVVIAILIAKEIKSAKVIKPVIKVQQEQSAQAELADIVQVKELLQELIKEYEVHEERYALLVKSVKTYTNRNKRRIKNSYEYESVSDVKRYSKLREYSKGEFAYD